MQKLLQIGWVGLQIGWGRVLGNPWGKANKYGCQSTLPLGRSQHRSNKPCENLHLGESCPKILPQYQTILFLFVYVWVPQSLVLALELRGSRIL